MGLRIFDGIFGKKVNILTEKDGGASDGDDEKALGDDPEVKADCDELGFTMTTFNVGAEGDEDGERVEI